MPTIRHTETTRRGRHRCRANKSLATRLLNPYEAIPPLKFQLQYFHAAISEIVDMWVISVLVEVEVVLPQCNHPASAEIIAFVLLSMRSFTPLGLYKKSNAIVSFAKKCKQ